MISLLRADLFKTRKHAMGWVLLAITGLTIILVMLNSALRDPSHVTYAFPSGLLPVGTILPLLGVLYLSFLVRPQWAANMATIPGKICLCAALGV